MAKKKTADKKTALGKNPPYGVRPHKEPTVKKLLAMVDDVMTVQVPRKHFSLSQVKILKDNRGLEVKYQIVKMDSGISTNETSSVSSHGVPHPDLLKAIENLSQYAVQGCGLVKYLNAPEVMQEYGEKALREAIDSYAPTGICINGQDSKRKAMITGVWNCHGNYKISLNTPNILLESDQFEFEDELNISVDEIEDEVFAYLFKNKRSQLELFNASEKKENDNDEVSEED